MSWKVLARRDAKLSYIPWYRAPRRRLNSHKEDTEHAYRSVATRTAKTAPVRESPRHAFFAGMADFRGMGEKMGYALTYWIPYD